MATSKKSHSPNRPPTWLSELLEELQRLRQDILRQGSSIRELRFIVLENQQILRTRSIDAIRKTNRANDTRQPRPSILSSGNSSRLASSGRDTSQASTSGHSSSDKGNRRSASMILTKQTIANANEAVRTSAVAITRPSRPTAEAVPKICWYHRQFGQTSVNCIQPCSFVAPTIPVALANHQPIEQINVHQEQALQNDAQQNNTQQQPAPLVPPEDQPMQAVPSSEELPSTSTGKRTNWASDSESSSSGLGAICNGEAHGLLEGRHMPSSNILSNSALAIFNISELSLRAFEKSG